MKRLVFMVVAILTLTTSVFAVEGNNPTAKWEGNINVDRLSDYLGLTSSQYEQVTKINNFLDEQLMIANVNEKKQPELFQQAISDNLKLMKQTLSPKQFAKYVTVMDLTLGNKGIKIDKLQ